MFQISLPAPDLSPGQGWDNVLFLWDEVYFMGSAYILIVQPDFQGSGTGQ